MKIKGLKTIEVFFGELWVDELFGELWTDDDDEEYDEKVDGLTINVNPNGTLSVPLNS